MSELKEFDDNIFDEDMYETPNRLFNELCLKYDFIPEADMSATKENTKCKIYFTEEDDALRKNWVFSKVWCNPPHSKTEEFVRKAYSQWLKYHIEIMMIIPTNTMSSRFWHECIEGIAEYHAVEGRPRFLRYGKPAKFNSRNAYVCVIFRKKPDLEKYTIYENGWNIDPKLKGGCKKK